MAGGFHPWHGGHTALYQSAQKAFPGAEVFVAATNDTSARPFPFAVKEKLAKLAGVAPGHFVQVRSPFRAEEITSKFDPDRDRLIFVRSEKDADKPPQAGGIKRDGSAAYLQPLAGQTNIRPFKEHAYMAYLPTVEFGPGMTSATEIRTAWPTLNKKRKTALVMSLYPQTQGNLKLADIVVKLLDAAIGTQEVDEGRKKKKSSRSTGGYFFPGYGYYGSDSGEGGGDGGGESVDRGMTEGLESLDDLKAAYQHHVELSRKYRKKGNREKDQHHTTQAFNIIQQIWEHPDYKLEFTDDPYSSQKNDALSMKHDSRFNEQGVAEGSSDTIYPNAEVIKSKNGKPVGEIYQDGNSWGAFHYRADRGYDFIDSREEAIEALRELHQETGRSGPDYTIKGVAENFADGRNPQDKGDAKRHGINTKASVSSLRKTAKQGGRKGQLAHWLANMKSGRAKNEDVDSDYIEEKWSSEYKSSINCADPKGFSQKAHCAGRKK
jgi:hypothetical protein